MPISKAEFESRQVLSEIERNILTFLERNRGNAYTMDEIMDGINFQTNFNEFWKAIVSGIAVAGFQSVLNNLVICGKVRMNVIQGIYYYMAK